MMRDFTLACLLMAMFASPSLTDSVCADEANVDSTKETRADEALELTRKVAAGLQMYDRDDLTSRLTFVESPLQRYTNPIAGEFYAHLFIWTRNGRPAAAAAIAKWYTPRNALHVELQSLALQPIVAELKQAKIWHPETAGITLKAIPKAPRPSTTAGARLRQMRQLARNFRAHVIALNRGEVDEDLRLLAKPIHRYKSDDATVQDGCIFSFVRGTDPELLLLIESRHSDDGNVWHYALAPLNSFEFRVYHREREVWQKPQLAPPWPNTRDPTKPYMIYHATE